MTDCEKYADMLSAYADGELSEKERAEVEMHLESCEACRSVLELYSMISESISDAAEPVPEGFAKSVMDKIETYEEENTKRKRSNLRSSWGRWIGTAACIAVILFAFPRMANLGCGVSGGNGVDTNGSAIMDATENDAAAGDTDGMVGDYNDTAEEKENGESTTVTSGGADKESDIGMIVIIYAEEIPEELIPYSDRGNADGDTEYIVPVEIAENIAEQYENAEVELVDTDSTAARIIIKR